jgi:PhnB protein
MAKKPTSVPRGYRTATPHLIIKDAASAIDFYKQTFGAKVLLCLAETEGKIGHAEIQIGDSRIMLADEYPQIGYRSPQFLGGSPVSILLYVDDCDTIFERAMAKGAKTLSPVTDQVYGDRAGTVEDPFGHIWTITTHKHGLASKQRLKPASTSDKRAPL